VILTIATGMCAIGWLGSVWLWTAYAYDVYHVSVGRGLIQIVRSPEAVEDQGFWALDWVQRRDGFEWVPGLIRGTMLPSGPVWGLWLPLWIPFVAFIAYPTVAFLRGPARRWRRRRAGRCIRCGYDLTGNESGVCPECGQAA